MDIGQRIKNLRKEHGISQAALASRIGILKQTLYKYEKSIITNIPTDKIEALATELHSTPSYLLGWETNTIYNVVQKKTVPILGRIFAGAPLTADDRIERYDCVEDNAIDYGFIVHGESMFPTIIPGSTVYIQRDAEIEEGCVVAALIGEEDVTVKRYYQREDKIILRPDNTNYSEKEYDLDGIHILGRVRHMMVIVD